MRGLISVVSGLLLMGLMTLTNLQTQAQQVTVNATFSVDSVKVGEPFELFVSAKHPANKTILFPDSGYQYTPFEVQHKKYFATRTTGDTSIDSAVYTLVTYEIDSIQTIRLPVFVVDGKDSTAVYALRDTVYLRHLVKSIPDSVDINQLPLRANTNYLNVRQQFNYFILGIVIGVLLVAMIIVWIIFGKQIRRYFLIRKLTRSYTAFLAQYERSVDQLTTEFSAAKAESSLVIWKKYLGGLLHKPYTNYTSREIRQIENDERLGQSLAMIDRMIYGGIHDNCRPYFDSLKDYVHSQYEKKKAELAHG